MFQVVADSADGQFARGVGSDTRERGAVGVAAGEEDGAASGRADHQRLSHPRHPRRPLRDRTLSKSRRCRQSLPRQTSGYTFCSFKMLFVSKFEKFYLY